MGLACAQASLLKGDLTMRLWHCCSILITIHRIAHHIPAFYAHDKAIPTNLLNNGAYDRPKLTLEQSLDLAAQHRPLADHV